MKKQFLLVIALIICSLLWWSEGVNAVTPATIRENTQVNLAVEQDKAINHNQVVSKQNNTDNILKNQLQILPNEESITEYVAEWNLIDSEHMEVTESVVYNFGLKNKHDVHRNIMITDKRHG